MDQSKDNPDAMLGWSETEVPPTQGGYPEETASASSDMPGMTADRFTVGLIDEYMFSLGCLATALSSRMAGAQVVSFSSVEECIARGGAGLDVLVYSSHEADLWDPKCGAEIARIRAALASTPLVLFSEAHNADPVGIRRLLQMGLRGFISTRTTATSTAVAAILLVKAGGSYAPPSSLLADDTRTAQEARGWLTSRQSEVLRELRQGKPNKIIAYELGMSESTVKVHIRNIMRKVGATNRTQVVYKAHELRGAAAAAIPAYA
jgi:DNA-binding NarL/FixJ family response regulator